MGIFLYADNIILPSPTIHGLQQLLNICEVELKYIDMQLNPKKSVCLRIGCTVDFYCGELHLYSHKTSYSIIILYKFIIIENIYDT